MKSIKTGYRQIIFGCVGLVMTTGVVMAQAPATNAATPPPAAADGAVPADVTAAMQMPAGPDQVKALTAAGSAWAKTDPIASLAWLLKLPPDLIQKVGGPITGVCAAGNPKATADTLTQTNQPAIWGFLHGAPDMGQERSASSHGVVRGGASAGTNDLLFLGGRWLVQKKPPEAAAWAVTVPVLEDRLAAIQGVALMWDRGDMVALTAWIKGLKPEEMKIATQVAVDDWRGAHFPTPELKAQTTAKDWLAQFPLSPEEQDAILKAPPLDPRKFPAATPAAPAPAAAH